jgi:spoIIIJ-associated protein
MDPIESEGKSVAEAVESALSRSGLRRDQVEITVLQEASSGFMGIGAKPARVRLSEKRWGPGSAASAPAAPAEKKPARRPAAPRAPKPAAPRPEPRAEPRAETRAEPRAERAPSRAFTPSEASEACAKAKALVAEVLALIPLAAPAVTASWDADLERVKVVVESQDASLLVGRDGRNLEALQFLCTLMMSRGAAVPVAVQVDALSYWEKRETAILTEARRAADRAKADGRPVRLEPMDASMRRLIHRTLANDPEVTTSSEGEGPWRKIVIRTRKA